MNMKQIKIYMIAGAIFVAVLGTILHFAYALSGNQILVGLFTPVNESIWEHTKLIYFPMLLYAVYLNQKLKEDYPCVCPAMIAGALSGVLFIITLFYTYTGIVGFHVAFIDISIFYISVIASFYIVYRFLMSCKIDKWNVALQILNILMIGSFILFTFYPPEIPLFIAP